MVDSWCLGAICCCCRSLVATFMMLSLGVRCCCCDCRSLAVLAMHSLGNLVLASAVYCRLFSILVLSTAAAAVHFLLSLS
ncbi:hypothetical protein MAM1_0018d01627 [Mucor ambiguus]|uniref:Uncharacterized protein n=1 Tax=Mucor ambiguus TaxID=91626 RepID=A0A0C9M1C8_9FUNG|nr:hypothetical protein MAM1_0018d01627 [Mucor ambiguus]